MNPIQEAYDKLLDEKEQLTKELKPLIEKREKILNKLRQVEAEEKAISDEIKKIERPRLYDLSVQIASLARMLPNHKKVIEPVQ